MCCIKTMALVITKNNTQKCLYPHFPLGSSRCIPPHTPLTSFHGIPPDGSVVLELSHGAESTYEKRWVAVSRKHHWTPPTVTARMEHVASFSGTYVQRHVNSVDPCTVAGGIWGDGVRVLTTVWRTGSSFDQAAAIKQPARHVRILQCLTLRILHRLHANTYTSVDTAYVLFLAAVLVFTVQQCVVNLIND